MYIDIDIDIDIYDSTSNATLRPEPLNPEPLNP